MAEQRLTCNRIFRHLMAYSQQHFTGRIDIQTATGETWQVYLTLGQTAWATGGHHPRRRWRRQLQRAGLGSAVRDSLAQLDAGFEGKCDCAEYHLLAQLARDRQLDGTTVTALLCGQIEEVLFDIVQAGERASFRAFEYLGEQKTLPTIAALETGGGFLLRSHPGVRPSTTERLPHTWMQSLRDLQRRVEIRWQTWAKAGLFACSPNLAPAIANPQELQTRVSPSLYRQLSLLLDGEQTLRDLGVRTAQDPLPLARSLIPYISQRLIRLERVTDLPRIRHLSAIDDRAPLVACVDDSPTTRSLVEMAVTAVGCRFLGIADGTTVLSQFLETPPDLAFIDLVLPDFNGYELCKLLRQTSQLNEMAIVMLSGNVIDRVRARVAGANDCLNKPIASEPLHSLLQTYASAKREEAVRT